MSNAEAPIGIFDSGVGGLTVMRAVADLLPHENLVYLGDTARVPYGNRSPATVRRYARNAAHLLLGQQIKVLVVACNTASAHALEFLQSTFDIPIIGVVTPVADQAAATTASGTVGVIGTRGTIASQCYRRALTSRGVHSVIDTACPLFVPLAEEGWTVGPVAEAVARRYLEPYRASAVDTLILGCTHYPLLRATIHEVIDDIVGSSVTLLDSAQATARVVEASLRANDALREGPRTLRFWATDDAATFGATAGRFFGSEIDVVEHVDIIDIPTDETTS